MNDRVLLVPAAWAPDPEAFQRWPSLRILQTRLEGLLPVDIFRWPWLKGEEAVGADWERPINAFRAQVRAEHHVVDIAGTGVRPLLNSGGAGTARSLATVSLSESLQTLESRGDTTIANFMRLQYELSRAGPAQMLPLVMQGADEAVLAGAIAEVQETLDRALAAETMASAVDLPRLDDGIVKIPCLFLEPPPPLAIEGLFEVFRRYAPGARRESLHEYGLRIHEEDGGRELADKVIPFIQGVIAAREKR
jgi:hypothetical protein